MSPLKVSSKRRVKSFIVVPRGKRNDELQAKPEERPTRAREQERENVELRLGKHKFPWSSLLPSAPEKIQKGESRYTKHLIYCGPCYLELPTLISVHT